MRPRIQRLLAVPGAAAFLSLASFLTLFVLLGMNIETTFLLVVLALASVVILLRPEFGVYFLVLNAVVAFAQYFNMPRIGPITLPLAVEGLLLVAFLVHFSLKNKQIYFNQPENWLLLIYTVLIVLSMLLSDHLGRQNFDEFRRLFVIVVLVYFLILNLIDTRALFFRLFGVLVAADFILAASGVLNRLGLLESQILHEEAIGDRTVGIIGNPNALAFSLIGLLPFVVCLILYVGSAIKKSLLVGLVITNLFVILSTLSRGGFVALAAAMLFMTLKVSSDRRLVALFALFAVVVYLIIPGALFERFEETQSLQGSSRYQLSLIGLKMALDNPVFGVGYGNFRLFFPKYDVVHRGGATAPHNMYTSVAAQTGFPSLLLYLGILILAWRRVSRLQRSFGRQHNRFFYLLTVAMHASLINVFVFGLSSHVEHEYLVFVVLGLILVVDRLWSENRAPGRYPAEALSGTLPEAAR